MGTKKNNINISTWRSWLATFFSNVTLLKTQFFWIAKRVLGCSLLAWSKEKYYKSTKVLWTYPENESHRYLLSIVTKWISDPHEFLEHYSKLYVGSPAFKKWPSTLFEGQKMYTIEDTFSLQWGCLPVHSKVLNITLFLSYTALWNYESTYKMKH